MCICVYNKIILLCEIRRRSNFFFFCIFNRQSQNISHLWRDNAKEAVL